jgi:glucokinase
VAKRIPAVGPNGLAAFDGKAVLSAGIAITGAGDGLSEALAVEPQEFHHGEKVYVVIETEVAKVRFDPVKDTEGLRRVHFLKAGTATIVGESVVAEALEEQKRKIEEHRGISRLELGDELERQHRAGEHEAGYVEGCDMCDDLKAEAEAAGAGGGPPSE